VINTDKNPAYGEAIRELKRRELVGAELEHRQIKFLNNRLEADHGPIKRSSGCASDARVQVDESRLRHHQRLRGDADDL
jgi:transposase-like protein